MYLTCDVETAAEEDHLTSQLCLVFFFFFTVSTWLCEGKYKSIEQQSWLFLFLSKDRTDTVLQSGMFVSYCRKGKKKLHRVVATAASYQ